MNSQHIKRAELIYEAMTANTTIAPSEAALTFPEAYAIQGKVLESRIERGNTLAGYKIGLTSKPIQKMYNASEPVYGALTSDQIYQSGSAITLPSSAQVRLEMELAFVVGKDISGPNATLAQVLQSIDFVIPALELVCSRLTSGNTPPSLPDVASDSCSSWGVVLGTPFRPDSIDLRWVSALCMRNGVIEATGVAAAVLNHPAMGLVWLANTLYTQNKKICAGQLVMGGSFTTPLPIRHGDVFCTEYREMGCVCCSFPEQAAF